MNTVESFPTTPSFDEVRKAMFARIEADKGIAAAYFTKLDES